MGWKGRVLRRVVGELSFEIFFFIAETFMFWVWTGLWLSMGFSSLLSGCMRGCDVKCL